MAIPPPTLNLLPRIPTDLSGELRRQFVRANGGLVGFQLKSYNKMVEDLSKIFRAESISSIGGPITFENAITLTPTLDGSPLLPIECHQRNLSYLSDVLFDVVRGSERLQVSIGKIPTMLRTNICNLTYRADLAGECDGDPGGYFILNGSNKVVVSQDRLDPLSDVIYMENLRLGNFMVCLDGSYLTKKVGLVIFKYKKRTKEAEETAPIIRLTTASLQPDDSAERAKDPGINVGIIYRILGVEKDQALLYLQNFIPPDIAQPALVYAKVREFLTPTFEQAAQESDPDAALAARDKISSKLTSRERREDAIRQAREHLNADLFPQIPPTHTVERINLMSYMLVRLVLVELGLADPDDRDLWKFKYIQTVSASIGLLVSQLFRNTVRSVSTTVRQQETSGRMISLSHVAEHLITGADMTRQLITAIKTGKWGAKGGRATSKGITEELDRLNRTSIMSQLNRFNTPTSQQGAQLATRMIKNDQATLACVAHTPDSASCGIAQHLGSMASLSLEVESQRVWDHLQAIADSDPSLITFNKTVQAKHLLLVNGRVRGWCIGPVVHQRLVELRRTGQIDSSCAIVMEGLLVNIKLTAGRPYSPFLIVRPDGELALDALNAYEWSWEDKLNNGVIEYLGGGEFQNIVVAPTIHDLRRFQDERDNILYEIDICNRRISALEAGEATPDLPTFDDEAQIREQILRLRRDAVIQAGQVNIAGDQATILAELQQFGRPTDDLNVLKILVTRLEKRRTDLLTQRAYTHCVVDPTQLMGIAAASVPYGPMMQAPRLSFQCGHAAQAISTRPLNAELRFDASGTKTLLYGQTPIMYTQVGEDLDMTKYPPGQYLALAIASYQSENVEDAIILNRDSEDAGLFRQEEYISVQVEENEDRGVITSIYRPLPKTFDPTIQGTEKDPFRYLEDDGIVEKGVRVNAGDCLVGVAKYFRHQQADMQKYFNLVRMIHTVQADIMANINNPVALAQAQDTSAKLYAELAKLPHPESENLYVEPDQAGIVDEIIIYDNAKGNHEVTIRIRWMHRPSESGGGDKFGPRCAQKTTESKSVPGVDLPFIGKTGRQPDAIINQACIPSRMTVSLLYEMLGTKLDALWGTKTDATAWRSLKDVGLLNALTRYGFTSLGYSPLYNPFTGLMMTAEIVVAPVHYQALKHQVLDKTRVRGQGFNDRVTGVPVKGRRQGGGIRFGEQERDNAISHGAAFLLQDRLSSDSKLTVWCTKCGVEASYMSNPGRYTCTQCHGNTFQKMYVPSAYLYTAQIMGGTNVIPRIGFEASDLGPYNIRRTEKTTYELAAAVGGAAAVLPRIAGPLGTEPPAGIHPLVAQANAIAAAVSGESSSSALMASSAGFSRVAEDATVADWNGEILVEPFDVEENYNYVEDDE